MNHTPGPWKVATTYKAASLGRFSIRAWNDQAHTLARVAVPTTRKMDVEEANANARLIAAAPEMLDALKFSRSVHVTQGIFDLRERMAVEKINAVLAKIEGKEGA